MNYRPWYTRTPFSKAATCNALGTDCCLFHRLAGRVSPFSSISRFLFRFYSSSADFSLGFRLDLKIRGS